MCSNHWRNILFILLILLIIIIGSISLFHGHTMNGDYALYIRQSKAIIDKDILDVKSTMQFMLNNSSDDKFSPLLYPWGFPILLSPVYKLFGIDFYAFKLYVLLFYVTAIVFIYLLFSRRSEFKWQAFFIALLIGMQVRYISFLNLVLSEMPYLFFVFFSVYCVKRIYENNKVKHNNMFSYIAVGILLMFTAQVRTEGILLFPALVVLQCVYFLKDRVGLVGNKKGLLRYIGISSLPYLSGVLFYWILSRFLPSGFLEHTYHFELFSAERCISNISGYVNSIQEFHPLNSLWSVVIFLLLSCWGMIRNFKENAFEVSFVVFSVLLLLVWPHQNTRYLFVLIPFFLYFMVCAIESFALGGTGKRFAVTLLFAVFLINLPITLKYGFNAYTFGRRNLYYGTDSEATKELVCFLLQHTSPREVIGSAYGRTIYLLTGRKALVLNGPIEQTQQLADWYVYEDEDLPLQYPASRLTAYASYLEERFRNSKYIVYKIRKNGN